MYLEGKSLKNTQNSQIKLMCSAQVMAADTTTMFNMFRENGACQFLMQRLEKKLMEDNYLVNILSLLFLS